MLQRLFKLRQYRWNENTIVSVASSMNNHGKRCFPFYNLAECYDYSYQLGAEIINNSCKMQLKFPANYTECPQTTEYPFENSFLANFRSIFFFSGNIEESYYLLQLSNVFALYTV